MLPEIASALGIINNSMSLSEKLFSHNKRTSNNEPEKRIYCSIFLEHSFSSFDFKALQKHKLELTLCKMESFAVPIRHLDWVIWNSSLEEIKLVDYKIPPLWSLPSQACLFNIDVSSILNSRLEFANLTGRNLRKTVKNMYLQCVYADGHRQTVFIPDSLQLAIFYKFYQSKYFFNWHQFLILNAK